MNFKVLLIIAIIVSIPIALFEYLVLFWFWGGDGSFTFFVTPIALAIAIIVQVLLIKKFYKKSLLCTFLKFSVVLLSPFLAMLSVWLIGKIFGINITIQ